MKIMSSADHYREGRRLLDTAEAHDPGQVEQPALLALANTHFVASIAASLGVMQCAEPEDVLESSLGRVWADLLGMPVPPVDDPMPGADENEDKAEKTGV